MTVLASSIIIIALMFFKAKLYTFDSFLPAALSPSAVFQALVAVCYRKESMFQH